MIALVRKGQTRCHGHDAALNTIRVEAPVMQVLASADATAHARRLPHDLRDQAIDLIAVRQEMSVATMVREHRVAIAQERHDRGPGELLANAGVHCAEQPTFREERQQAALGGADGQRLPQACPVQIQRTRIVEVGDERGQRHGERNDAFRLRAEGRDACDGTRAVEVSHPFGPAATARAGCKVPGGVPPLLHVPDP